MIKLLLVLACVASSMAISIPFDRCEPVNGAVLPAPLAFAIPECNTFPCNIQVGQTVTLLIGIAVDAPVTSLPVQATVTVDGYTFDFPLPTGDACAGIPTGCPQIPGNYLITFPTSLSGVDAGTEVTVRVQIDNHDRRALACGSVTTTFA